MNIHNQSHPMRVCTSESLLCLYVTIPHRNQLSFHWVLQEHQHVQSVVSCELLLRTGLLHVLKAQVYLMHCEWVWVLLLREVQNFECRSTTLISQEYLHVQRIPVSPRFSSHTTFQRGMFTRTLDCFDASLTVFITLSEEHVVGHAL